MNGRVCECRLFYESHQHRVIKIIQKLNVIRCFYLNENRKEFDSKTNHEEMKFKNTKCTKSVPRNVPTAINESDRNQSPNAFYWRTVC